MSDLSVRESIVKIEQVKSAYLRERATGGMNLRRLQTMPSTFQTRRQLFLARKSVDDLGHKITGCDIALDVLYGILKGREEAVTA